MRPALLSAALLAVAVGPLALPSVASAAPGDPYDALAVTSFSWHKTDPGELEAVAQVANTGSLVAEGVEVDVNYQTNAGKVLGSGQGLADPTRLAPGERTTIAIDDDMPSGTQQVVVSGVSGQESAGPARRGFTVTGLTSVVESDGDTHYTGTVTNTSAADAQDVGIFVSLFNNHGIAIGELGTQPVQPDQVTLGVLYAHQSLPFDIDDDGTGRPAVASYSVLVDAEGGAYPVTSTGPVSTVTTGVAGTPGGTGVAGIDSGSAAGTVVSTGSGAATIGSVASAPRHPRKKVGLKLKTHAAKAKHGHVVELDAVLSSKLRGVPVYLEHWTGRKYVIIARTHSNAKGVAVFKMTFATSNLILKAVFPGTASYTGASSPRLLQRVL
jgi:hypothetical protein